MKHVKKRISKIVDELTSYFFLMGATKMTSEIEEKAECFIIRFSGNYNHAHEEMIENLITYLEYEKQEEIEEYYWELAGDCDLDTELCLVGMMIDEADIFIDDNMIKLNLVRFK